MLVSDFGVNLAQDGLVTTIEMIEEHPDTVRAMTRAILRGYAHAIANPQDAVDALFKNAPDLAEITTNEAALESVIATVELAQSPVTEESGLGYQTDEEFQQSEEILIAVEDISRGAPELSFYYTNDFLPEEPVQPDSY
jgi:NitT/TauT family transport system substrate-binding protein